MSSAWDMYGKIRTWSLHQTHKPRTVSPTTAPVQGKSPVIGCLQTCMKSVE